MGSSTSSGLTLLRTLILLDCFKEEYGERGFEEQEMLKVKDIKAKLQTQDNGRQLQNDYLTIQFIQRV